MLRWQVLFLGLLLTQSVWTLPEQAREPMKFQFRVEPPGAAVYVEAVSNQGNVVRLGLANEPIVIDRVKFRSGLTLHIGGEMAAGQTEVPHFHGYLARQEIVSPKVFPAETPNLSVDALPVIYYPGLHDSEPIQLKPAPGAGAFFQRLAYSCTLHPILFGSFVAALSSVAFFLIAVVVPRQKAWREENAKVAKFNARLRSLDIQNDVFLGRQFGEWATVKRLGAGGMAVVYKGISTLTMNEDEAVAVKVMNPELAQDQDYRRRFSREVQISRTLDHPNVVRMIDYGEQDGILYLSMEYIQGETLRDMLPSKGMPLPDGIPIALGIVQGLIHAHQKGIVHRDLKPDNVMVTDNKLVKVMDLGLAKREESENVTRTGDTFGTPAYMAPEQITGGTLLPATDQYALGVMMFELFTGRRPFEVADSLTLVMKHLQEPPPRIREYKSQLPDELENMIDRMLLKDPSKRFKGLVEVQVELTKIQRKYCGT
ncbi:MAG: serine/threonine protein kinase [Candidatus Eremiobacteraeota bacterium]|nr:serine/threonine protein kinase [Candidatus Eremiobacteraeota bacterium]MCW5868264.1 serine/threonine protein kinase [Candidatus Eremiobacteraeota bacterium]